MALSQVRESAHMTTARFDGVNVKSKDPLSLQSKYIELGDTYFCRRPRPLRVLFSGNLKPTKQNILRVIFGITRSASSPLSRVILDIYATTRSADPRVEWLKKHRTKVVDALLNHRATKFRRGVAAFFYRSANRIKNPSLDVDMVRAMSNHDIVVKTYAVWALWKKKHLSRKAYKKISRMIVGRNAMAAIETLSRLGNIPNRFAERKLIKVAKDVRHKGRHWAVQALTHLKKKTSRSEKAIIHVLKKDSNPTVRSYAAMALAERGHSLGHDRASRKTSGRRSAQEAAPQGKESSGQDEHQGSA